MHLMREFSACLASITAAHIQPMAFLLDEVIDCLAALNQGLA